MNKINKKRTIKIPNNTKIFYCAKKKIIIFKGLKKRKSLKINDSLTIDCHKQKIEITSDHAKNLSNTNKKKIYMIQNTTVSLIRQILIEITATMYQKLKLVGVGYRVFPVENFENYLLLLKLGYSHPIYIKTPSKTKIFTLKLTTLFLSGHSYQELTFTASKIRLNKKPEPYKGKGILYENEKIILKEGKKI